MRGMAAKLKEMVVGNNSNNMPSPNAVPLEGVHDLVYSDAEGSSSGKIWGPIFGKVRQKFVDAATFQNRVEVGGDNLLELALTATRQVLDDGITIQVSFEKVEIMLFGNKLSEKEISGGGKWKMIYVGELDDEDTVDGGGQKKKKLVRIFEAPSLFVTEHRIEGDGDVDQGDQGNYGGGGVARPPQ